MPSKRDNTEISNIGRTANRSGRCCSPVRWTTAKGGVTHHFLSYLDITRRYDAEGELRTLTSELERRVAERTRDLEASNAKLEAANQKLSKLLTERNMLLSEVNHRAKNSLAVAASLLAIQGRRQPDRAVRALFEEAQDRLNAMARVHDLLSKSESIQRVDLATYVTDLCEALSLGIPTKPAGGTDLKPAAVPT